MTIDSLPQPLLDRILTDARGLAPDPLAILMTGSYAAGKATPTSDLDLTVILRGEWTEGYRTWFAERAEVPLHVSVDLASAEQWLARCNEPADWSLGFPTDEPVVVLWTTEEARVTMGTHPLIRRPVASPELEDFFEGAGKTLRALWNAARAGARWHAHAMAALAPGLIIPLNGERRVSDRRDALRAALELSVAPEHYADDLAVCLGIMASDDAAFQLSAQRLPREMLVFLRERAPDVDPQPWISRYLADGTLERHLDHIF